MRKFVKMKFTFGKQERLKSKTLLKKLYEEGKSIKEFPLRMVYLQAEHLGGFPAQAGVSVPKRNFKRAVDRNRIKRLLREAYRKQKFIVYNGLEKPYVFMISYIGNKELPYETIEKKIKNLLISFVQEVKKKD